MPILCAEPQVFPEHLFEANSESRAERTWSTLHTKPRQEKSLARQLLAGAIPFFLPLVSKRHRVRQRTMTSHLPLFPGYIFLLAESEERLAALATHRVVRTLAVADQEGLWRDLVQINRLIVSGAPISPEGRLALGKTVEIRTGPLAGLRGKITGNASRRRFVVEVDFIQRGASILLDELALMPVID